MPHAAGVPVIGAVPFTALPALGAPLVYSAGQLRRSGDESPLPLPTASIEDALREVGYTLAHRHPGEAPPVVVLMGTRSDDSTASLAAHIAATLVRDGLRVTLVDADRLRPRLNRVFGKADAPGLADLLRNAGTDPRSILHIGAGGNLRFLAAGSPQDSATGDEDSLRRVFRALAAPEETDLVLVSGPAVWGVRTALPLEQAADGMVLVAPPDAPPAESVARARRLLSNGYRPRILGVVIGETAAPLVSLTDAHAGTPTVSPEALS